MHADDNDFGGEIIPKAAQDHKVMAYLFNGYW
jgi:ADP-glucose pyrophosphorylase